jgi:hypothetical protein
LIKLFELVYNVFETFFQHPTNIMHGHPSNAEVLFLKASLSQCDAEYFIPCQKKICEKRELKFHQNFGELKIKSPFFN